MSFTGRDDSCVVARYGRTRGPTESVQDTDTRAGPVGQGPGQVDRRTTCGPGDFRVSSMTQSTGTMGLGCGDIS